MRRKFGNVRNTKEYYIQVEGRTYKNDRGVTIHEKSEFIPFKALIVPKSGELENQIYGLDVKYYKDMYISGNYTIYEQNNKIIYDFNSFKISEGSGICYLNKEKADYKVVSAKEYTNHIIATIKKVTK